MGSPTKQICVKFWGLRVNFDTYLAEHEQWPQYKLHLSCAGKTTFVAAQGEAVTPRAHADSLSMAGATVHSLKLSVVNHYADLLPKVCGSLGEDFLRCFDLPIDNRRCLIQFEASAGVLCKYVDWGTHGLESEWIQRPRDNPQPTDRGWPHRPVGRQKYATAARFGHPKLFALLKILQSRPGLDAFATSFHRGYLRRQFGCQCYTNDPSPGKQVLLQPHRPCTNGYCLCNGYRRPPTYLTLPVHLHQPLGSIRHPLPGCEAGTRVCCTSEHCLIRRRAS